MEKIDVHCHAITPAYKKYLLENGQDHPDGMPSIPDWSPEHHLKFMASNQIAHSILSITSPGVNLLPPNSPSLAKTVREFNTELSLICRQHPDKLSFFASLPLPDTQASIEEIDHAIDTLGAKGFIVLSNINGIYLGDSRFDEVWKRLNVKRTLVFIHPTTSNVETEGAKGKEGAGNGFQIINPLPVFPGPMMEFMFDETRAVTNLLLSGTVEKYPHIRYIMSHTACALPSIIDRIGPFASVFYPGTPDRTAPFKRFLRERFWFDLAGSPFPTGIRGLLAMLGGDGASGRLLYGSDFPLTPGMACEVLVGRLENGLGEKELGWGSVEKEEVWRSNAKALFGL